MNEPFEDMVADLVFDEEITDLPTPVSDLTDRQLLTELSEVRRQLVGTPDMIEARTERGRELHSRRAALLIESNRRSAY